MKTKEEIIYRCDFCNKPMFGKGAMSRHEKYCKSNPNNKHKCFEFCKYLQMNHEYIEDESGNRVRTTQMICTKRDIEMYSFKFEKNTSKPKNALDGLERMPLNCDFYENEHSPIEALNFDEP